MRAPVAAPREKTMTMSVYKRGSKMARYGKQTGDKDLIEFIDETYLPWARQNKRTWKHDELRARTIADWLRGRSFRKSPRF